MQGPVINPLSAYKTLINDQLTIEMEIFKLHNK
jgi:hypothetical protein